MAILEGIRILDLSRLLPGPFCTQVLGDLGAEVIKIEEPIGGDYTRWYPPLGKSESGLFLGINRNKKSMKLNLRSAQGKEIFLHLVETADVVVEQFRPGVLERMGLGFEVLQAQNPQIILCSISGYGQSGPYQNQSGHDINYLALSGILAMSGTEERPLIPGIQIADVAGGSLWALFGILAALLSKQKTGKGQWIDVAMSDGSLALASMLAGAFFMNGQVPRRQREPLNGGYAWYQIYRTRDERFLAVGLLEFKFWERFCKAIGRPEFAERQYEDQASQLEMMAELQEILLARTAPEWVQFFEPFDICVNQVNTLAEAVEDPHYLQRDMIIEMDHPLEGVIKSIGLPVKFSAMPEIPKNPPPAMGQHSEEILDELGYSEADIIAFKKENII